MDIYSIRQRKDALRRMESTSKVTGSALYLDDMELQGMAYGGMIRSPYPHCEVVSIDASEALAMRGVLGFLTPDDVPQIMFNVGGSLASPILQEDQHMLTWHPVHEGDRIAAMVAEDPETLARALKKVKVEYKILPATMKADDARKEGARLIRPDFPAENYKNNCFFRKLGTRGDVEKGFAESDVIFEGEFTTPTQHPIPMELTGAIGWWNRDGRIEVWATTQVPYQVRRILAHQFSVPESHISVHRAMIGGGFGHREDMYNEDIVVALSRLIYRPVKLIHDRSIEMTGTATRHASHSYVKMGCTKDGKMVAFHQIMYTDGGPYCTQTPLVTSAPDRKMPYHMPYFRYDGIGVLTNGPCSGAFRGYGNPQGSFARESLINDACRKMGWDPVKFRMDNCLRPGETMHGYPIPLSTFPYEQVLGDGERIRKEIDAAEGLRDDEEVKEGWGFCLVSHTSSISSLEGLTGSAVNCLPDGSVVLMTGTTDMGQGAETALTQVCAEKLGMDFNDVRHASLDTSTSPYNIGSYSSGQMYLTGNAVAQACEVVIGKARTGLAKLYRIPEEKIVFDTDDKKFRITGAEEEPGFFRTEGFKEVLTFKEAILEVSQGCHNDFIMGSAVARLYDAPPPFAACWAKIAYFKKENAVLLKHIIVSVDIGRVMNPLIVKGQLEGGVQNGAGFALMEDLEIDPRTGKIIAADLLNYRNPLMIDMPEIHIAVADNYEPHSANGCKSVGELALIPIAPAIRDAAVEASGQQVNSIPLSRQFFVKNLRCDSFFEGGVETC